MFKAILTKILSNPHTSGFLTKLVEASTAAKPMLEKVLQAELGIPAAESEVVLNLIIAEEKNLIPVPAPTPAPAAA